MTVSISEICSIRTGTQAPSSLVTIVVIPEILSGRSNTITLSHTWTRIAPNFGPGPVKILLVEPGIRKSHIVPWEEYLNCAWSVRFQLHKHVQEYSPGSIYFIGQGLGGLLVKNIFNLAFEQKARYSELLARCAGIAFLATPHIGGTSPEWLARFISTVKPTSKSNEKRFISPDHLYRLFLACEKFKICLDALPISVLSGYISRVPKTSKYFRRRGNNDQYSVDYGFACIGLEGKERLEEIDCTLDEVFQPSNKGQFPRIIFEHCEEASLPLRRQFEKPEIMTPQPSSPSISQSPTKQNGLSDDQSFSSLKTTHLGASPRPTLDTSLGSSNSDSGFALIPESKVIPRETNAVLLPCYFPNEQSFQPIATFTGRNTELKAMKDALVASDPDDEQDLRTYVLHGIGGSGKTQLSLTFLALHYKDFDAVFFLKADSMNRLETSFCDIAVRSGLEPESMRKVTETCKSSVIAWLENPVRFIDKTDVGILPSGNRSVIKNERVRWLMVLDNADHPEVLSTFWPKAGKGSILLTSRDPMTVSQFFFPTAHADLKGLPEEDAVQLLLRLINETKQSSNSARFAQAKELVKRLEYLPLAIDQIGAILCKQRLDISAFLEVYAREQDFSVLKGDHPAQRNYDHTLATVWALDQLKDESRALLYVMAMLDPEHIHEDILQMGFTADTRMPNFPQSKVEYYIARGGLLETSMVSLVSEDSLGHVGSAAKVHRLVQSAARSAMLKEGTLTIGFRQALASIDMFWPSLSKNYVIGTSEKRERWEICNRLFPHIEQLSRIYKEYSNDMDTSTFNIMFVDLLGEAGWYQCERENPRVALPLLHVALEIAEGFDQNHAAVISGVYSGLVWSAVCTKNVDHVFYYAQRRMDLHEALLKIGQDPTSDTAVACNDLGMAYAFHGVYDKAKKYLKRSKDIRKGFPGFQETWLFTPSLQLGKIYWKTGKYEKGATVLLDALRAREAALGPNDRDSIRTGYLLYFLGNIRASQSRNDEAYSYHQRALNHQRLTVGDKAPATLRAWYRVGEHELRYGRNAEARSIFDSIVKAYGEEPYRKHERARGWFFHSKTLSNLGHSLEADNSMQNAVKLFNQVNPNDIRTTDTISLEDIERMNYYDML